MPQSKEVKIEYAQYLYRKMPLSRFFIKEAYIKGNAIYYRGDDNILRIIKGAEDAI